MPLWSRAEIVSLFDILSQRLEARGVKADVYVVGGAAITLAYDARRTTRDIDAMIRSGRGAVVEEVKQIARERGLPSTWLNEQATSYISTNPDRNELVVYDGGGLRVAAASARHLLAMKTAAARPGDIDDIRLLAAMLDVTTASDVFAVHDTVLGGTLGDRQRKLIEDLFPDRRGT